MKNVIIFGSTGSIGRNALEVIRQNNKDFRVLGLCALRDVDTLCEQVKIFSPPYVCLVDQKYADKLKRVITKKTCLFKGEEGLHEFSSISSDISLMSISGISSLKPLLTNIAYAKRVALANKEALVTAGNFVFSAAKRNKTEILPVDSEINALFQLLDQQRSLPRRVYLTASGGALFNCRKKISAVKPGDVLRHPTWQMGKKITVDCATLVNKAFEAIEAHMFFGLTYDNIGITIHRESNVHAMVEFNDNSLLACMYPPDMKMPIAFSLYYPLRKAYACGMDFSKGFSLNFVPFQANRYPLFSIIIQAAKRRDNSLTILNSCDEVAIDYFLKEKIKFSHIYQVMSHIFEKYPRCSLKNINDVFYWDDWARNKTREYLDKLC